LLGATVPSPWKGTQIKKNIFRHEHFRLFLLANLNYVKEIFLNIEMQQEHNTKCRKIKYVCTHLVHTYVDAFIIQKKF
jgi:hypothetical protein